MEQTFDPVKGAEGCKISNIPILSLAPIWLLDMFDEIGMDAIIEKR
jgi:kynureninase